MQAAAGKKHLTTTCLINNYNYASFVVAAVESALQQTTPFDQIIVVDDGSTDDSLERLRRAFGSLAHLEVVSKHNQGQLSCFNEGAARATGDIVFFLDADDEYEPNHVQQVLSVYEHHPRQDFVFCGYREIGERSNTVLKSTTDRDLGYSVVLTAFLREWIGAKTSCLSMRREVLDKVLPVPFVEDWQTRADDCLIFGASLAGARKYYLAEPTVRYRVHGKNAYCRSKPDEHATYRRRLAINRLFEHLERKFSYNVARLADFHHREFRTIARPTLGQLLKYLSITRSARLSVARRLACAAEMTHFYLRSALRSRRVADAQATAKPRLQRHLPFDTSDRIEWDEAPRSSSPHAA